jgi:hypothetical protein
MIEHIGHHDIAKFPGVRTFVVTTGDMAFGELLRHSA